MAGPIRIAILANGRQARSEAALTARAYGVMGRQASKTGKLIAGAFAVGSLVRLGVEAGRAGATYVSSLNKIQALTGSTDKQIDRAAQHIEGNSSVFAKMGQAASDAAGGIVELTKSGLSLSSSLRAVRATMVLAKAGELEVADASALVANTLNTFSLKAKQAGQIANGLANAANISSADVTDLAESFKYAAPLAAKAGLSLAQTNAVLAELSNSGIKASQAGTSLRGILLSLQAPSTAGGTWLKELGVQVYGADGRMRDFGDVIEDLRRSLGKLSQEDQNFALKSIFGRNSITGAQVLLKGGRKALDEYTRGVKRAGAAQKLAESASKGLAGSLGSVKAETVSTVQELYRRFSPALDARLQSVASYLADNKDEMVAAAIAAGRRLGPALEALGSLAKSAGEALADTAVPIAKDLLPAIEELAGLAKDATDALNDLPGPVKEIGVQAAIAALVLPRLTTGVTTVTNSVVLNIARLQQWRAEMTNAATRAQQTAAMMQRLGAAARTAAGVGGMVALTQSMGQTDTAMGQLLRGAGLMATGFAVGGPVGGAVGGLAGTVWTLYDAFKGTNKQTEVARQTTIDYADAIDQATAKLTEFGRQQIIQKLQADGVIAAARAFGITTRDLVGATLGQAGAMKRVNSAYAQADDLLLGLKATKIGDWIYEQNIAFDQARNSAREAASGFTSWKKALHGVPRKVQVRLENLNYRPSFAQWRALNREIRLTPKQRQIIIKAIGYDPAIKGAKNVGRALDGVGRKKGNLAPWLRGLTSGLSDAELQTRRGVNRVGTDLDDGVRRGAGRAAGTASSGGRSVGSSLKSGIFAGFAGTAAALAAQAAAAVRQAVAAAKHAGEIHSPSRLMDREVGKPLAQGLVGGFIRHVSQGTDGISKVLDRLRDLIEKRLDGKKQADRRKALLKSLKAESAALRENGKLQDKIAKKLESATTRYKTLVQTSREYATSVRDGFQSYGSVVGLGATGGGTAVTLPALLSQLAARAGVAQQFATVIEQLKSKLNKTSLKQLLDQAAQGDLEGALATAQAIASGGAAAVTQINALTAQISKAGGALGESASASLYGAGIKAAEAVVKGLERRQRRLDRVADRLADHLVNRIQDRLGIGRSTQPPKRTTTVAETHTSRTPALDTYMRQVSAPTPAPQTITIRLTAEQVSQLQRGREIQADLDVYRAAGGRAKVKPA